MKNYILSFSLVNNEYPRLNNEYRIVEFKNRKAKKSSTPARPAGGFLILSSIFIFQFFFSCTKNEAPRHFDVIVIGEGTGATSAAIQSARSGAKTLWINPLAWGGGMLTAAGVSATDGNHRLPAGLWGEFRERIRNHYGGADSVFTGWVSNTMFEPKVGAKYWQQLMDAEALLTVWKNSNYIEISKNKNWKIIVIKNGQTENVSGKILIDGTDLGDVAAEAGATFDLGMDARNATGEAMAPEQKNDIVQDLTYTAILKDFGKNANKTIPKPENYDASQFYCACQTPQCDDEKAHPCDKMLSYGKLPNGKYMINFPLSGNDYYANLVTSKNRAQDLVAAKNKTLQFVYFIQTELGYSNLGLAEDEFPTEDHLPLYPYHREGRRIHGKVQLNVNHILKPYDFTSYRTGVAVGDYPIDHHHKERPDAPEIDFPKVPSFNIPLGSLIPKNVDDLLLADKAISVTNIVNGASRLQPVMIQVGQAAGLVAAMAAVQNISPKSLNIRQVQSEILKYKGYLMPFIDVLPDDSHFESIQKIGATGILRGKGIPYLWANQTWFYPDTLVDVNELLEGFQQFDSTLELEIPDEIFSIKNAIDLIYILMQKYDSIDQKLTEGEFKIKFDKKMGGDFPLEKIDLERPITKKEFAVLLDKIIDPFNLRKIDFDGQFKQTDVR